MFERFPYTDFHDLNLDWILDVVKECVQTTEGYDAAIQDIESRLRKDERWIDEFDTVFIRKIVDAYLAEAVQIGVYFDLTEDGHFRAHYPNWHSVRFATTGLDFQSRIEPEAGHLAIIY